MKNFERKIKFPYRLRVPNPDNMLITGDKLWSLRIQSLMPFDIQYRAAVPTDNNNRRIDNS